MLPEDFELAFKSSKKVSKHHPSNFQKRVIDTLNKKYDFIKTTSAATTVSAET